MGPGTMTRFAVCVAAALFVAKPLRAQVRSGGGFDVTLGQHIINGGFVEFRRGMMLDALGAIPVRASPKRSVIVAAGAGGVLGGNADSCLLRPDGGCAPKGNFGFVNALGGVALPLGNTTLRALAGPAIYDGGGDTSIGLQARIDFSAPLLVHFGIGAMLRATVLPSHGGDRLTMVAFGGSLTLR